MIPGGDVCMKGKLSIISVFLLLSGKFKHIMQTFGKLQPGQKQSPKTQCVGHGNMWKPYCKFQIHPDVATHTHTRPEKPDNDLLPITMKAESTACNVYHYSCKAACFHKPTQRGLIYSFRATFFSDTSFSYQRPGRHLSSLSAATWTDQSGTCTSDAMETRSEVTFQ